MPRIDAPTVAEHHARRRASLIEAATDLLACEGVEGVTLAAVGASAGLARSSVYQYFDSTQALLAAVVEEAFPRATAELIAAVEAAESPREQVEIYIRTCLDAATDQTHRSLTALDGATLTQQCRTRIVALHREQLSPLIGALTRLGVADPALTAGLIRGVIGAGSTAILYGAASEQVATAAIALVEHGILGAGGSSVASGPGQ